MYIYCFGLCATMIRPNSLKTVFQMLNKEHEKAEDAKPATVSPVAGS